MSFQSFQAIAPVVCCFNESAMIFITDPILRGDTVEALYIALYSCCAQTQLAAAAADRCDLHCCVHLVLTNYFAYPA